MDEVMTYEEFLKQVKAGIVTAKGNCPITSLLVMLQRDLMPVFYAMVNWGFKYEDENEALLSEE